MNPNNLPADVAVTADELAHVQALEYLDAPSAEGAAELREVAGRIVRST